MSFFWYNGYVTILVVHDSKVRGNFFKRWIILGEYEEVRERYIMSREKMLNRQMLVSNINKICELQYKDCTVSDLIHKGGHRHRVEIAADGSDFYMDFHFKDNGSTSIDISSGLHIAKKKQIMTAILNDPTCLNNG